MNYVRIMDVTASGLQAGRTRMNIIAQNIANAETTRTAEGGPYRRKIVVLQQANPRASAQEMVGASSLPTLTSRGLVYRPRGVAVVQVTTDSSPSPRVYNPGHPDADADGYVQMPNVEIPLEMVDLLAAAEAYEANAAVLEILGKVIGETINLLR